MARRDFDEQAALRRATWHGGVAHSLTELENMGLDFWVHSEPNARLKAM
jgi:hypothetical protein